MNASLPDEALTLLRRSGLAAAAETPRATALSGGVSSDIWRVELAGGPICVKRALPRLRVAQRWEAPVERNRFERRWIETAGLVVPGAAPRILAGDDAAGLFAMQYLELPLWKAVLREGRADPVFAAQVGATLAAIHAATAGRDDVAQRFRTDAIFHAIRLEPYLLATAAKHPDLSEQLHSLVKTTSDSKRCLVHGDVSPKNILVGGAGPVFLDAECAWYGDPAFDLAFCLNHLLLKCLWVPERRDGYLACFDALELAYLQQATWEPRARVEQRTAALLPGLMLARIDGKSPVEYVTEEAAKNRVRSFAERFLRKPCSKLAELAAAWRASST